MSPNLRNTLLCLLASASVGVVMAGATYVSAYRAMRDDWHFATTHDLAAFCIVKLKSSLEDFHIEKGRYPEKLSDLSGALTGDLHPDAAGRILDPWTHPYEYRSDGQTYTLRSLGLDGKAGGPGLARDVDARDIALDEGTHRFPFRIRPTFWQYTFDLAITSGVRLACALGGVFAAVACFAALRDRSVGPAGTVGRLLGTLIACFVATMVMAMIHVPSGH